MYPLLAVLLTLLVEGGNALEGQHHIGEENARHYGAEWTAHIEGGAEVAQLVALQAGYRFEGQVLGFPDTYVLSKDEHEVLRRDPAHHFTRRLTRDTRVKWADQQYEKTRMKRGFLLDSKTPLVRVKIVETESTSTLKEQNRGGTSEERVRRKRALVKPLFNDELWAQQWYLQDTRMRHDLPRLDLNVLPVYQDGINGAGVRVLVLDDGLEHDHQDLKDNYDSEISWDCNDSDSDPAPRSDKRQLNSHGTRCAGEIAMAANNGRCGVGVAWGASVGGVRMLDGRVNDRVEGEALGYAWDKVDVYSASWGPNDDGRTVEGPGRLALYALKRGVEKGRNGKGVIFVWANGNGGSNFDNCNCDGYSSSIYTISIGSASQRGRFPWYGETCSSTMAVAYSSGAYDDQKIATTDVGNKCTLKHTGTSAAAPLAAGIIALALQANAKLSWRDVQHLVAWTAEQAPLADGGWRTNSAGLMYDARFGFGILNAAAMVAAARNWTSVPRKTECRLDAVPLSNGTLAPGVSVRVVFAWCCCAVEYLEHVELLVNVRHSRRGAVRIVLISPRGTDVEVLSTRKLDDSAAGFVNWRLTSVATWGERPQGVWTAVVQDATDEPNIGTVGNFALVLHGTSAIPAHMLGGPRHYDDRYYLHEDMDVNLHDNMQDNLYDKLHDDLHVDQKECLHGKQNDYIYDNLQGNSQDNQHDNADDNDIEANVFSSEETLNENILSMEGDPQDNAEMIEQGIWSELEKALLRVHHRLMKTPEDY